jgi:hypothetical protein
VIGDENMKKIFIASCVAVLAMTAASAATRSSTEYFIVLDTKTKKLYNGRQKAEV